MAGANYMGGRRNSARARTKDVTGRTQKGHFMRQRHQIFVRGLRNDSLDEKEQHTPAHGGRVEEIGFSFAKKDLQRQRKSPTNKPPAQPKTLVHSLFSSSSPSSSKQKLVKNSKILEDMDINEPSGLKATLRRILRQPDLAGLSRLNSKAKATKQHGTSGTNIGTYNKRQKTCVESSNSSSPSFRYDSSTRKRSSSRPQLLVHRRPPSSANYGQPGLKRHTSNRASSILAEKSDSGHHSIDTSLDHFSIMQEAGSSSSYPDSGFSELLFSDYGKEYAYTRPDVGEGSGNDTKTQTLRKSVTLSLNDSLEPRSRAYQSHSLLPLSAELHGNLDIQADDAHHEVSYSQSLIGDSGGEILVARENQRYGVGYVPPDPNAMYKPFVPLATMLPSYSDEDYIYINNEVDAGGESALEEPMEIDEQIDYLLKDGNQFPYLESNAGRNLPTAITSSLHIPRQRAPHTPRRVYTSPVGRLTAPHRSRFSLPAKHSVASVLSATKDEQGFFFSQNHLLLTTHGLPTPSTSFTSLSSGSPQQTSSRNQSERLLRCITEVPKYEMPISLADSVPAIYSEQEIAINSESNPVNKHSLGSPMPTAPVATDISVDEQQELSARDLAALTKPPEPPDTSPDITPTKDKDAFSIQFDCEDKNPPPTVFNGPDLFVDDAGDEDDE